MSRQRKESQYWVNAAGVTRRTHGLSGLALTGRKVTVPLRTHGGNGRRRGRGGRPQEEEEEEEARGVGGRKTWR